MITRGGLADIFYYRNRKKTGLTDEYFSMLPPECQEAIFMAGDHKRVDLENAQKRRALESYLREEARKEKRKAKRLSR